MSKNGNFLLKTCLVIALTISSFTGFSQRANQITDSEKEGILLMREEEKLAHDVYFFFANKYNIPIFRNIAKSEAIHQNLMISLMNKYGIDDPSFAEQGKFYNEDLQELYYQLTAQGNTLIEALKVGAFIEDLDIFDVKQLMKETDNEDILWTYNRLLWGSKNHLRAFVRNLLNRGIEYVPSFISIDEMNAILNYNNLSSSSKRE